jgi:hypothetical protein
MGIVIGIVGSFILAAMVAIFWVRGIDYMKENHPDYKGDDFLNWDEDDKNTIL